MDQLNHRIAVSVIFSMMFLSVAHAELLSDEKWSFDFNNVSILDAFDKIKKEAGVEFVVRKKTPQPIMITYCKKNQSIQQIYRDLLRNVNYISSWNYSDDGKLESINIVLIGQKNSDSAAPISKTTDEQKKLKDNLVKQPDTKITATTGGHNNVKLKLPKPPASPNIPGLEPPPSPPGG